MGQVDPTRMKRAPYGSLGPDIYHGPSRPDPHETRTSQATRSVVDRVGSGQQAFKISRVGWGLLRRYKISRVGSGRIGSGQLTRSDPTREVFDLTRLIILFDSRCMPRSWDFPSGSSFFFFSRSVLGEVVSSQIGETSGKILYTSIVARVAG